MTESEPSAPLPDRPVAEDRDAEIEWLRAEVARLVNDLEDEAAGYERAEADLAAERARVARVEALCDDWQRLTLPGMNDWDAAEEIRRALSPVAEPRCPHVAEPGSRHEDEDCPCVEGGA